MSPRQHIARCIRRCAKAKDGRGAWRAERDCVSALAPWHGQWMDIADVPTGRSHQVATDTAAAARRVGEWLRDWQPARS